MSLPLVNEWTQDRSTGDANRTPRWRGITTLHELRDAGVKAAMASDNTRDQFYAYGDLDMLEVFTQGVRLGHLDRPYSDWPNAVTQHPADAMQLPEHGRIAIGGPANFVLFRARRYSELLSRPQIDRVRCCCLPLLRTTSMHTRISDERTCMSDERTAAPEGAMWEGRASHLQRNADGISMLRKMLHIRASTHERRSDPFKARCRLLRLPCR